MKKIKDKNLYPPSKKVVIFANWFRVGIIGLVALPYLFHSLAEIIW